RRQLEAGAAPHHRSAPLELVEGEVDAGPEERRERALDPLATDELGDRTRIAPGGGEQAPERARWMGEDPLAHALDERLLPSPPALAQGGARLFLSQPLT